MPRVGNNLVSIIYVKYDDIDAGNSLKNNLLGDKLKEYVPIKAITKTFHCSHKNKTVTVQLKLSWDSNFQLSWGMPLLSIILQVLLLDIWKQILVAHLKMVNQMLFQLT